MSHLLGKAFDKLKSSVPDQLQQKLGTLPQGQQGQGRQQQQPASGPQHGNGQASQEDQGGPRFEVGARIPIYPQPGQQPPGPGQMPPKVAKLEYRDRPMRFFHPNGSKHDVLRDLGFTGVIDGKVIWGWGDTLMGTEGHCMICANDSTSLGSMKRPMTACDTAVSGNNVSQWIPPTPEEQQTGGIGRWSYGGTNIIEIAPNKGIVYYLKNDRKGGGGKIMGAGVAHVHVEGNVPKATRAHDVLWDQRSPWYGDVGVAYDSRDGHVYAYGHGPDGDKELSSRTFLCRVPKDAAMDVRRYEYWDNEAKVWRKRQMTIDGANGSIKLTPKHAIFDWFNMNQSAPFWSNHFNKWMFIHSDSFPFSDIKCKTADKLEGPWTSHGGVAKTDPKPGDPQPKAFRYCVVGHPEFDPSGRTVLATWTKANVIWGVVIHWE